MKSLWFPLFITTTIAAKKVINSEFDIRDIISYFCPLIIEKIVASVVGQQFWLIKFIKKISDLHTAHSRVDREPSVKTLRYPLAAEFLESLHGMGYHGSGGTQRQAFALVPECV